MAITSHALSIRKKEGIFLMIGLDVVYESAVIEKKKKLPSKLTKVSLKVFSY